MSFGKDDSDNDGLVITDIFEKNMNDSNENEDLNQPADEPDTLFDELSYEDLEEGAEDELINELDSDEDQNKKKKKKSNKPLIISLVVVLVLVVGIGTVIGMGMNVVNEKMDKVTKVQVDRKALGIDPRVAEELKGYRNIAMLGIDSRDIKDDSGSRSDAMIIASIHKTTGDVRLLSIYRDTFLNFGENIAQYGGVKFDKINHAYFYGKAPLTLQVINRNLDLNCEEVIVVNWKTVADTVDSLGGLDIRIKKTEIAEMNKYILDTQRNIGGSRKRIHKAGMQTLNGNQAVTYARIRHDATSGDVRRNERMEKVVSTAFAKVKTLSLTEINEIADKVLPQIKTNMTTSQLSEMVVGMNKFNMGKQESWPYEKKDARNMSRLYVSPPVTLKSNVIKLHERYFDQKDYNPTDTVKKISDEIVQNTMNY